MRTEITRESTPRPAHQRVVAAPSVDGTRIAADLYEPTGATVNDTLVFISGLGYGPWSWEPLRERTTTRHRALLPHHRGTGASEVGGIADLTIADLAADVLALITTLDPGPVHLVGTSMGGYIALEIARSAPDSVRSVVTIASSSGGPEALPVPASTAQLWRDHAHLAPPEFAEATMSNSFAPGWAEGHFDQYHHLLEARSRYAIAPGAWAAQSAACERFLRDGLPAGDVDPPVTAIHGTNDRVVPYENLQVIRRRIPQAHTVTLEGAGHLCWLERPGQVADLIRDHLDRVHRQPDIAEDRRSVC